jgi:broad specificity phosphatase PhoE
LRVVFVRHGETAHNQQMVITSGSPGNDLTELGVEQIIATAATVKAMTPSAIYASPLRRAKTSAGILSTALHLPVHLDDGFQECSVGDLEGRSEPEAFERFNETMDRWYLQSDLDFPLGPGGETAREALRRAEDALLRIEARHSCDETIIVVTHQTLLQLILVFLGDLIPEFGHRRWISNAGVCVLIVSDGRRSCTHWDGEPVSGPSLRRIDG